MTRIDWNRIRVGVIHGSALMFALYLALTT